MWFIHRWMERNCISLKYSLCRRPTGAGGKSEVHLHIRGSRLQVCNLQFHKRENFLPCEQIQFLFWWWLSDIFDCSSSAVMPFFSVTENLSTFFTTKGLRRKQKGKDFTVSFKITYVTNCVICCHHCSICLNYSLLRTARAVETKVPVLISCCRWSRARKDFTITPRFVREESVWR